MSAYLSLPAGNTVSTINSGEDYFSYIKPLLQPYYDKQIVEYHIEMYRYANYIDAYEDNTGRCLWSDIEEYLRSIKAIKNTGLDFACNTPYIWLHLDTSIASIDDIINVLTYWFYKNIRKHVFVPSLQTIISSKLKRNEHYLVNAAIEYQKRNGYDKIKSAMNIYFTHILPRWHVDTSFSTAGP